MLTPQQSNVFVFAVNVRKRVNTEVSYPAPKSIGRSIIKIELNIENLLSKLCGRSVCSPASSVALLRVSACKRRRL